MGLCIFFVLNGHCGKGAVVASKLAVKTRIVLL